MDFGVKTSTMALRPMATFQDTGRPVLCSPLEEGSIVSVVLVSMAVLHGMARMGSGELGVGRRARDGFVRLRLRAG